MTQLLPTPTCSPELRPIGILGAGGHAREILQLLEDLEAIDRVQAFYESDAIWKPRDLLNWPVLPLSQFSPVTADMTVAIGNSRARYLLVEDLPPGIKFLTLIHPSVIRGSRVTIGEGATVCAGTILSCDIHVGKHVLINRGCNISHDCVVGDFSSIAPSVALSGYTRIGRRVFVGTGSKFRERCRVTDDCTVGMGSVVINDLIIPGTYAGVPAKLISHD